jgi:hypothetical protein
LQTISALPFNYETALPSRQVIIPI